MNRTRSNRLVALALVCLATMVVSVMAVDSASAQSPEVSRATTLEADCVALSARCGPGPGPVDDRFCAGSITWNREATGNPFEVSVDGSYTWDDDISDGQPVDPVLSAITFFIDDIAVMGPFVFNEDGGPLDVGFGLQPPDTTYTYSVEVDPLVTTCASKTASITVTAPAATVPSQTTLSCVTMPENFLSDSIFCSVSPFDASLSLSWTYSGSGTYPLASSLFVPGGCGQTVSVTVSSTWFPSATHQQFAGCL